MYSKQRMKTNQQKNKSIKIKIHQALWKRNCKRITTTAAEKKHSYIQTFKHKTHDKMANQNTNKEKKQQQKTINTYLVDSDIVRKTPWVDKIQMKYIEINKLIIPYFFMMSFNWVEQIFLAHLIFFPQIRVWCASMGGCRKLNNQHICLFFFMRHWPA